MVETEDRPGALVRVLESFSAKGINLSKLESRPGPRPWSYRFFIDLDICGHSPDTAAALADARNRSASLRVLGSYPRWRSAAPG